MTRSDTKETVSIFFLDVQCTCHGRCKRKGKVIPVTGRGGPYVPKTSRLPHLLGSRLAGGGEVVRRHAFYMVMPFPYPALRTNSRMEAI
jgi:hypothetical protein